MRLNKGGADGAAFFVPAPSVIPGERSETRDPLCQLLDRSRLALAFLAWPG
jgi:hypothetical protein